MNVRPLKQLNLREKMHFTGSTPAYSSGQGKRYGLLSAWGTALLGRNPPEDSTKPAARMQMALACLSLEGWTLLHRNIGGAIIQKYADWLIKQTVDE